MELTIPKRIIQTGKTKQLSISARAAVVNVKALNPDFEHCYFDDQEVAAFVATEFPEHKETFDTFPYRIQKYDFFRYLAVFRLGGFYFDLDVYFAEGLQALTQRACVFPFEELTISRHLRRRHNVDWEIGNFGFGAAPGHPFLGAVIENCVKAHRDPSWVEPMMSGIPRPFRNDFYVLNTTGPGMLSRTLAENPSLARQVSVLFPADVCDRRTWHHFGQYGVHAMEGTWRSSGGFFKRKLSNLWESRIRKRYLEESQRLGKTRVLNHA